MGRREKREGFRCVAWETCGTASTISMPRLSKYWRALLPPIRRPAPTLEDVVPSATEQCALVPSESAFSAHHIRPLSTYFILDAAQWGGSCSKVSRRTSTGPSLVSQFVKNVRLESLIVKPLNATGRLPIALIRHGKPTKTRRLSRRRR
jgi:hypothetical protein